METHRLVLSRIHRRYLLQEKYRIPNHNHEIYIHYNMMTSHYIQEPNFNDK